MSRKVGLHFKSLVGIQGFGKVSSQSKCFQKSPLKYPLVSLLLVFLERSCVLLCCYLQSYVGLGHPYKYRYISASAPRITQIKVCVLQMAEWSKYSCLHTLAMISGGSSRARAQGTSQQDRSWTFGVVSIGLSPSAQMDQASLTSLVLLRCAVVCRCLLLTF